LRDFPHNNNRRGLGDFFFSSACCYFHTITVPVVISTQKSVPVVISIQ
jgi:hypothetical protein